MNKSIYLALSLSVAISAPSTAEGLRDRLCDKHLLSVSPDGSVTRGSKAAIVEAVESGKSIRVGFGLGPGRGVDGDFSLTHWFNPSFMTVLGGEVFTQTPIIHSQRPVRPAYDVDFPDAASRWVGTIGTNGQLHSKGLLDDKVADFQVYSWWCLAE